MENLQRRLENAGIKTRSYSGRGMYGATCLAATAKRAEDIYAVIPKRHVRTARTDSMGLDVVAYWSGIPFNGAEGV
jgi:hypothetical protein